MFVARYAACSNGTCGLHLVHFDVSLVPKKAPSAPRVYQHLLRRHGRNNIAQSDPIDSLPITSEKAIVPLTFECNNVEDL